MVHAWKNQFENPNSIVFEDRSLFLDFDERKHQFN
jgi:hypothetical protein